MAYLGHIIVGSHIKHQISRLVITRKVKSMEHGDAKFAEGNEYSVLIGQFGAELCVNTEVQF